MPNKSLKYIAKDKLICVFVLVFVCVFLLISYYFFKVNFLCNYKCIIVFVIFSTLYLYEICKKGNRLKYLKITNDSIQVEYFINNKKHLICINKNDIKHAWFALNICLLNWDNPDFAATGQNFQLSKYDIRLTFYIKDNRIIQINHQDIQTADLIPLFKIVQNLPKFRYKLLGSSSGIKKFRRIIAKNFNFRDIESLLYEYCKPITSFVFIIALLYWFYSH